MTPRVKKFLSRAAVVVAVLSLVAGLLAGGWMIYVGYAFSTMADESARHAGTWEDDPQNWFRAFNEPQPSGVTVVHSKYWRSNHFTFEYAYYFEVRATPEWREAFLQKGKLQRVPPEDAQSFNRNSNADMTPAWFAPEPLEDYEVWDIFGHRGSVWIRKRDGHIFFWQVQF